MCCCVPGVYCTMPIAEGQLFGPFAGEIILEGHDEEVNYRFAWEVRFHYLLLQNCNLKFAAVVMVTNNKN